MLFSSVMLGLGLALGGVAVAAAVAVVVFGLEGSEVFCNIMASSLEGLAAVLVVVLFVSVILCFNRLYGGIQRNREGYWQLIVW